MHTELESYLDQAQSISQDAPGIVSGLTDAAFNWRPAPNRWSIAECFDHLNATARVFMPSFDTATADGRQRGLTAEGPFVHPLLERLFLRITEPPSRIRFRAPRQFAPAPERTIADTMREFYGWQDQFAARVRSADGLDLRRIRIRSPAAPVTFSLGTGFAVFLAHERRHLHQARRVRTAPKFPSS